MNLLHRAATAIKKTFYPEQWVPQSEQSLNYWQMNKSYDSANNTAVEACVSTISQTVAMLPIKHIKTLKDGGTKELNSPALKVLKKPNIYQTRSDFFLNMSRALLLTGNSYAFTQRDNRSAISALHIQRKAMPYISPDAKDIFYSISDDLLVDINNMVPQRDMLHIKLHTNRHPLIGDTPLTAAAYAGALGNSIQAHDLEFFNNMARPSGALSTDLVLTTEQMTSLRDAVKQQGVGENTGKIPILSGGLKYQQFTMSAVDAQVIETYNMTVRDIASVFRVPLPLINYLENATLSNVAELFRFWLANGLNFILDHIELSLNDIFDLPDDESFQFDTDYLLRMDSKSRMETHKTAVQGGITTINEARKKEGLPPVENGDKPLVQQQMVPLDWHEQETKIAELQNSLTEAQKVEPKVEEITEVEEVIPPVVVEEAKKELNIDDIEFIIQKEFSRV